MRKIVTNFKSTTPDIKTVASTCPHDCPSSCSLAIDLDAEGKIVKVRGEGENTYTAGVICAKVARYAERIHHPDRLTKSYRRIGDKGEGAFQEISFEDALDEVAEAFIKRTAQFGSETIWPYYFAGTMGLVQRDCINRLRHLMDYSGEHTTICTTPSWSGYVVGTGALGGVDPREMAKADCIIIWGTNPVATQVNVITHAVRARKERGARIVVVDIYETGTMKQADHKVILRPGTDGALACALMHVLFRDGFANREYLEKYTDDPIGLEQHLKQRTPQWAASITGLTVDQIVELAHLIGKTKRTYFRIGYGFSRQQNGTVSMHAVTSIAAVTGTWLHEGGGAFHSNSGVYPINNNYLQANDAINSTVRNLDQSRIGAVLLAEEADLYGGPPVTGLLVQNTNPMVVAPNSKAVREGFLRDDLFTCVHEQFMTETALMADIVLPATMFTEHDDVYRGGGHTHVSRGSRVMDPPEGCHSNYEVICGLAKRLGIDDPAFTKTAEEHVQEILGSSPKIESLRKTEDKNWFDIEREFKDAHYIDGFNWPDGKFRFKPVWDDVPRAFKSPQSMGKVGDRSGMPLFPDHWNVNENSDEMHPFKLATSPARQFLNTTFTETPTSIEREGRPTLLLHPDDAERHSVGEGDEVVVGNEQGEVHLHARRFAGLTPGTMIAEGVWPHKAHKGGDGINTLITDRPIAPFGGASFHDCRVWLKRT